MPDEPIIWTISEVNRAVKEMIEGSLMPFYLAGEVGSINIYNSGHVYLTLKDERCQLRAAYFGGAAECRKMNLSNGDRIECIGKLSVYEVRGEYQFTIKKIRPVGQGDLQRQFELIKSRLNAEGLFDSTCKKPLPALPRTVGIITSANGAALRDFVRIAWNGFAGLSIKLFPAVVQGETCALSVARGVEFFNRAREKVDLIVIARGGGSMEDLWGFNDEKLARIIAASQIPVISAIGHEIDFTITDFVADVRASTPSAAAELVVSGWAKTEERLERATKDLRSIISIKLERCRNVLQAKELHLRKYEPSHHLQSRIQFLDETSRAMLTAVQRRFEQIESRLALSTARLSALDPKGVLKRGYALLIDESTNEIVRSSIQVAGRQLKVELADGSMQVVTR